MDILPAFDTPSQPVTGKAQPWVEKYRPNSVDEIAHQEEITKTLKNAIQTGKIPHLLLYGPPGTGKTSTILALAKNLFGKEDYKSRILELNASDERGIKVVREKVNLIKAPIKSLPKKTLVVSAPGLRLN